MPEAFETEEEESDQKDFLDLDSKIKLEVNCDYEIEGTEDIDENDFVAVKKARKCAKKRDPDSDFQCYHCGKIIQTLAKIKEHITEVHKCPPRRFGEPRPFNCDQVLPYYANMLFYPSWNRLYRFT